jgi:hypothetical protein
LICIVMAAPLGALFSLFGGFMGYLIQRANTRHPRPRTSTPRTPSPPSSSPCPR